MRSFRARYHLHDVAYAEAFQGWIVGSGGKIASWNMEVDPLGWDESPSGLSSDITLYAVTAGASTDLAWAVGSQGTIVRTQVCALVPRVA